jgi:ubiquinone/menaquinone biosynthesis C-methylase UbiE
VRLFEGPALGEDTVATDVSADGAFLRANRATRPARAARGERLRLSLEIPTDPQPIELSARIVRVTSEGVGVRFEEVSARDRARLRAHAGFYEMDEAIVRLQRALGDVIPGNLLPLGERSEVEAILRSAVDRGLALTAVQPGRGFKPLECRLIAFEDDVLRLDLPLDSKHRVVYLAFSDPPLHYAFEGIVVEPGPRPMLLVPERIYLTERRSGRRSLQPDNAWCELAAPHALGGRLRFPVLDMSEGGASVRLPAHAAWVPGTHLPPFTLDVAGERLRVPGAAVRYVALADDGSLRAGLRFGGEVDRETFQDLKRRPLRDGLAARLSRTVSFLGGKIAGLIRRPDSSGVEVVRYRNRLGDKVAGIVDANFDTSDPDARPDVAVVIAPAILKRKEVFGLLARTIVDDLGRDGRKVVVLRFDASHIVGESAMDPRLVAEGRPYYHWTFGHLGADTEASLHYLERRFRPAKRVLVSVSLSAIPARKVILNERTPPVDLWISPYGCPDAQDVMRNYLAGLDLFEAYRKGQGPETVLIHGRPMRGVSLYGQAMADGLAFLEDARRDLSQIQAPVVWIVGTYDCWVTRSRVRAMLEAPGGGVREVFECATGHILKTGAEAIELFKLVSESISKHLFQSDRPARDPDLARFALQNDAEWARVRRQELGDAGEFWKEHLLGAPGDEVGYDVLLEHPEYPRFLARQVELLDPRPGEDVADFGCGTGNLTLAMLDSYGSGAGPRSITFIDLVPEGVARTEEKVRAWYAQRGGAVPERGEWRGVVADLDVPPSTERPGLDALADGSFDRIGCSLVLPYLRDPLATLREMRRLLRPGGTLVVSSIQPNFDPSKLYTEGVEILSKAGDAESERKLEALRHYGNMVSRLMELEEDGRFRFLDAAALTALVSEAGFARAHAFHAFGSPPTAILIRAEA